MLVIGTMLEQGFANVRGSKLAIAKATLYLRMFMFYIYIHLQKQAVGRTMRDVFHPLFIVQCWSLMVQPSFVAWGRPPPSDCFVPMGTPWKPNVFHIWTGEKKQKKHSETWFMNLSFGWTGKSIGYFQASTSSSTPHWNPHMAGETKKDMFTSSPIKVSIEVYSLFYRFPSFRGFQHIFKDETSHVLGPFRSLVTVLNKWWNIICSLSVFVYNRLTKIARFKNKESYALVACKVSKCTRVLSWCRGNSDLDPYLCLPDPYSIITVICAWIDRSWPNQCQLIRGATQDRITIN